MAFRWCLMTIDKETGEILFIILMTVIGNHSIKSKNPNAVIQFGIMSWTASLGILYVKWDGIKNYFTNLYTAS